MGRVDYKYTCVMGILRGPETDGGSALNVPLHSQNPDLVPETSLVQVKHRLRHWPERQRERSLLCSLLQQIEGRTGPIAPFWKRKEAINQEGRPSVESKNGCLRSWRQCFIDKDKRGIINSVTGKVSISIAASVV
jgi:hypothetical protein